MTTSLLQPPLLSPRLQIFRNIAISFFIWLLLEGAIRKWLVPTGANALFFVKYAIWGLANVYFVLNNQQSSIRPLPFMRLMAVYFVWGIFSFFLTGVSYNFLVGVLGFLVHFWFMTLPFILPLLITSKTQIVRLTNVLVFVCLITALVGIVQYFSPSDSLINRYASEEETLITTVGDNVRVTSVFSYITVYAAFLNIVLMVLFVKLLHIRRPDWQAVVLVLVFGLCVINAFMTASRWVTFQTTLEMIIMALVLTFNSSSGNKFLLYVLRFLLLGGLLFWLITQTNLGTQAFGTLLLKVEGSGEGEAESRVEDIFTPLKYAGQAGPVGYGLGTTYQGAAALVPDWGNMPRGFEEEPERIVLETGLIGYCIVIALRISIFLFALRVYRLQQDSFLKTLALMIAVYSSAYIFGFGSLLFNWIENAIYWSLVGILIAIYQLSLRQTEQEDAYRLAATREALRRQQTTAHTLS